MIAVRLLFQPSGPSSRRDSQTDPLHALNASGQDCNERLDEMTDRQSPLFKPGDVVRVKPERIKSFTSDFAKKVQDRDAVVEQQITSSHLERYRVVFQLRNGRGKRFVERMRAADLYLVQAESRSSERDGRETS